MGVKYDLEKKRFILATKNSSYIMQVLDTGYLTHLYWGQKINNYSNLSPYTSDAHVNLDVLPQEYSVFGTGDLRSPSLDLEDKYGSNVSELKYLTHKIILGKPSLSTLPATYTNRNDDCTTLIITLLDEKKGVKVELSYSVFDEYDVITRSVTITNVRRDNTSLSLNRALSICIDFEHSNYELLQLSGAWCREKYIYKRELVPGIQGIDSKRGFSSHQQSPFIALTSKHASESQGEVYGFNLIYSGNFLAEVLVDQFHSARVTMGINPFLFAWKLEANETFEAPEVVMVYSNKGLGEMSRTYHSFYRKHLLRGQYKEKIRPILINNWEATYFNFTEEKILEIASAGAELGMELFVLDDGWFGYRDSDNSSLGDWFVDIKKLPNGISHLANKVTEKGMQFGLWFEPEMISPDSNLYKEHPDWCLHVHDRTPMASPSQRNQLVLDLSRREVCDAIIDMMSDILSSGPITYVKWDMNRSMTDVGSSSLASDRQLEVSHRYVLGLYYMMDKLTTSFPHVLFESCASGGGRYDGGILYYMPQTWTSDDTDCVERLKIQYGTSMVYPAITMGSHISASPNHQVGRSSSLKMRGHVAMSGNFGYELDLTKFTEEEKAEVKEQITFYKSIRHIIQFGSFYRLLSPFEGNETAWMYVSEDKKEAICFFFRVLQKPHTPLIKLKLDGLDPNKDYRINDSDLILGGDELMFSGILPVLETKDFTSCVICLKEV